MGPCHPGGGARATGDARDRTRPPAAVAATIAAEDVEETGRVLTDLGARVVAGPVGTPAGRNLIAVHPDGSVDEYADRRG